MCCPSVVLFLCMLTFKSWLQDQDSGFRNRAIKHSLKTRQEILGYRGSTKMHKTIGTLPCTLRQSWVSVLGLPPAKQACLNTNHNLFKIFCLLDFGHISKKRMSNPNQIFINFYLFEICVRSIYHSYINFIFMGKYILYVNQIVYIFTYSTCQFIQRNITPTL